MKKKIFSYICVTALLVIGLTGCGSSNLMNMTDTQRVEVSEYAAQLLFKYHADDTSRLVDLEEPAEEPVSTPVPTPIPQATQEPQENAGMDETEDTPIINSGEEVSTVSDDPKAVLGLPETISIQYQDFELMDSYADATDNGLVIEAKEGSKLLICNFVLINDGAEKQSVDMLKENIGYVMQIDGSTKSCSVTMLSNDLTTYLGILEADESRNLVVITECEEAKLVEAQSIALVMKRGDQSAKIQVK